MNFKFFIYYFIILSGHDTVEIFRIKNLFEPVQLLYIQCLYWIDNIFINAKHSEIAGVS